MNSCSKWTAFKWLDSKPIQWFYLDKIRIKSSSSESKIGKRNKNSPNDLTQKVNRRPLWCGDDVIEGVRYTDQYSSIFFRWLFDVGAPEWVRERRRHIRLDRDDDSFRIYFYFRLALWQSRYICTNRAGKFHLNIGRHGPATIAAIKERDATSYLARLDSLSYLAAIISSPILAWERQERQSES